MAKIAGSYTSIDADWAYKFKFNLHTWELRVIGLVMRVRGQLANEEFLQEIGDTGAADADRRVFEGQTRSTPAACRVVKIRDAAGGEATQDA